MINVPVFVCHLEDDFLGYFDILKFRVGNEEKLNQISSCGDFYLFMDVLADITVKFSYRKYWILI